MIQSLKIHSLVCAAVFVFFPAALPASTDASDPVLFPPQSLPIEYYRERGLIPEENSMAARRRRKASEASGVLTSASSTLSAPGTFQIDLTGATRVENTRIVVRNTGDVAVTNPWVVANGERNWFSCDSIVQEAVGTETNTELRAFRIWNLMLRGRYHWPPAEAGIELHSPVKYLNVYGCGLCDDSATNLELLWKRSGLTTARTWGLNGHVVSEVLYGGAYHVLDADLESFYPLWTNLGAAGVQQLAADGPLVERVTPVASYMYTSTKGDTSYQNWWNGTYTMAMTLRPGESLERCHTNWGKFHDNYTKVEPPSYGNGRQTWTPDLTDFSRSAPGFLTLDNVQWTTSTETGAPLLTALQTSEPATLVWNMKSAYVFVGGSADLHVRALDAGCSAQIAFRKAATSPWQTLQTVTGPFDGITSVPLDSALAPLNSSACYSFDLRVVLSSESGQPGDIGLDSLSATAEIQCNPRSLPTLLPERNNAIKTAFTAVGARRIEVLLEWEQRDDLLPFDPPSAPISPANGAVDQTSTPVLTWESDFAGDDELWRKVVVSWDAGGYHPVSPLTTNAAPMDNEWQVPARWLLPNKTYYWRVREGDEHLSQWSPPWSFTTSSVFIPVAVSSWTLE